MKYCFDAIGTAWQIDVYQTLFTEDQRALKSAIQRRIDIFDKDYSRFRADSLVTQMSHTAGTFVMPDDAEEMFSVYRKLYDATGGLVTPLIGQVLVDAGYDAQYSLTQQRELITPPAWDDALQYQHPHLTIKQPILLDFGAAGKGYLIDIVAGILEAHDVHAYCVDAGGDMIHKGQSAITVGLENPVDTTQVIGVVTLHNQSLCGSAGNRRKWGAMHHIVNPSTLESPRDILAVWVMADTTIVADGLTTALFFTPATTLAESFMFEYLLLRDDFSVEKSTNFPAELFTRK